MKMKYSIIPSQAISDKRLLFGSFRTLAALCCYTSSQGLCFPNQITIGDVRGVTQSCVAKHMKKLRELGYVVDLVPIGKKYPRAYQRGNRYFVPVREGYLPPPLEVIRGDALAETRTPPNAPDFHT